MAYEFTDRKSKKKYSEHKLALLLHKEGEHIIYSDIEGVAILLDDNNEKQYYLIDECNHCCWIDQERFIISETL
jgi:hypothetical protein